MVDFSRMTRWLMNMNNGGLSENLLKFHKTILANSANMVRRGFGRPPKRSEKWELNFILNSIGPAAAECALEYTFKACYTNNKFSETAKRKLTNNARRDLALLLNDSDFRSGFGDFNSVLRQFLLPRYAYLDFDVLVDPRHMIDMECGYPKFITPIMYRYMYDRDDVAQRVVNIYPDECWAVDPEIYEVDDEDDITPFEEGWKLLCTNYNMLSFLYRLDKLAGVGHYGALLVGVDDGADLEKPIEEPELLAGVRGAIARKQRNLLYVRPFDEYLSFIHQYETDVLSPRYGLPKFYNLVFLDMTIDAAGASIGTRLNRRVHWTRVVHVAEDKQSSLVFGIPRQQSVFNRELDIRKIMGGGGEMFWKGAFPGISFEVNPNLVEADVEFDKEKFDREIDDYSNGLRRYLRLIGVSAKSLAPQVADPEGHVRVQKEAIASNKGVPFRIWMGSEAAKLASAQDKLTWNNRLTRRNRRFTNPDLLRNVVDRFVAIGVLPPPTYGPNYTVDWADLNKPTDEDKANLALKWTQALAQYVSSGCVHIMSPMDYLTIVMGFRPSDAKKCVEWMEANGGLAKLQKVDPSQGSGANGKRKNYADDEDSEHKTADREAEGMAS